MSSNQHPEPFGLLSAADRVQIIRLSLRKAKSMDMYRLLTHELDDAENQLDSLFEQLEATQRRLVELEGEKPHPKWGWASD